MAAQLETCNPIDEITALQENFASETTSDQRKQLGQFFTGKPVAGYMASLATAPHSTTATLLDAGAGIGILTAATTYHLFNSGCNTVHAVLYELDPNALAPLKDTLALVSHYAESAEKTFTYEIHQEDFVLSRPDKTHDAAPFDLAVINPPYFKYSAKDSVYAKATADLFKGDPNIYASFLATTLSAIKPNGQLISINPRSFTNGLYFKGFRTYLLANASLDLIHIFRSRDKVFKSETDSVLQETVICRYTKREQKDVIEVRRTECNASIDQHEKRTYDKDLIIDKANGERIIRIPETDHEAHILKQAESLPKNFTTAGYYISTGPVVEHRTLDFITDHNYGKASTPLLRPHNIKPTIVNWTGYETKDVLFLLNRGHQKHTLPNERFVLLKRFSSKDERRRLIASVFEPDSVDANYIAVGNKINYIGVNKAQLSKIEALGLSGVFNSTFMDKYFRSISGNTQVNATEIRLLRFPSRQQVKRIGQILIKKDCSDQDSLDAIVDAELNLTPYRDGRR